MASILQCVDADRALECVEGVGIGPEVEILKAMLPDKAAAMLMRAGSEATASRLLVRSGSGLCREGGLWGMSSDEGKRGREGA